MNQANVYGETPLSIAVKGGHIGIVKELVAHKGVELNQPDPDDGGRSPIAAAEARGNSEIASILKHAGATGTSREDKWEEYVREAGRRMRR